MCRARCVVRTAAGGERSAAQQKNTAATLSPSIIFCAAAASGQRTMLLSTCSSVKVASSTSQPTSRTRLTCWVLFVSTIAYPLLLGTILLERTTRGYWTPLVPIWSCVPFGLWAIVMTRRSSRSIESTSAALLSDQALPMGPEE